jgi:hypothetical protein
MKLDALPTARGAAAVSGALSAFAQPGVVALACGQPQPSAPAVGLRWDKVPTERAILAQETLVRKSINRQNYVNLTRVHAGGDGAMGPNPERETV